jgi:hypothetical protein
MLITKKDRSFILLIISFILVIYSIFSALPYITHNFSHKNYQILTKEKHWLNVNEQPDSNILKSNLILLSFFDDNNADQILINSRNIKRKFGFDITLISVYQGNDDKNNIEKLIKRFNLDFPIIFDTNSKISNYFQSKKYNFILLNIDGEIHSKYQLNDFNQIKLEISKIIDNNDNIKEESFKIPYQQITPSYILSSPSFIDYKNNININNQKQSAIIISNSGHNNLILSNLEGKIIKRIGSKKYGLKNGNLEDAQFNYPQGFAIKDNIIYLADSGNHSIRKIDLDKNEVSTLIGSGIKRGSYLEGTISASKANLWFPTDLSLTKDKKNLIIANFGAGQILSYNFKNRTISSLTKPKIGINPKIINNHQDRLYFIDQNIIKYLDKNNEIKKFKINDKEIKSDSFHILQNILLYSNNKENLIGMIDLNSKEIVKNNIEHNKISDLIKIKNNIYAVETNDDRIIKINRNNSKSKIFDILPKLEVTEDKVIKFLPNFNFTDEIFVKSDSIINVNMNLKKGWKLNNEAPSFVNLVEIDGDKKAKLIQIYNWQDIEKNQIKLPKLKTDFIYYIKAIIYYCKDQENSICMVKEYHKKINVSHNISNKEINIDFIYQ